MLIFTPKTALLRETEGKNPLKVWMFPNPIGLPIAKGYNVYIASQFGLVQDGGCATDHENRQLRVSETTGKTSASRKDAESPY